MVSLGRCTLQYPFHKQSLPVCLSVCLYSRLEAVRSVRMEL